MTKEERAYRDAFKKLMAAGSELADVVGFVPASAYLRAFVQEWTPRNQGGRPRKENPHEAEWNSTRRPNRQTLNVPENEVRRIQDGNQKQREAAEKRAKIVKAARQLIAQARGAGVPEETIRLWTEHPGDREYYTRGRKS